MRGLLHCLNRNFHTPYGSGPLSRMDTFDCRYSVNSTELDTPSDAIAVIFEDANILQKVYIFFVKSYGCTYSFEGHNAKLRYDGGMTNFIAGFQPVITTGAHE